MAAVTRVIRLGMSTLVVPDHDPIVLAKQISSLDHFSSGRVMVGVGAGWNLEEIANHRVDPRFRVSIMCERVEAMKAIWTHDEAEYHGRFVDFDPIWQWPKPVQRPHPPILFGGQGPGVLDRVLDYGTGWLVSGRHFDEHRVAEWFGRLQDMAAARGRGPVPVSFQDGPADRSAIETCLATGLERYILRVPVGDEGTVEAALVAHRALVEPYLNWRPPAAGQEGTHDVGTGRDECTGHRGGRVGWAACAKALAADGAAVELIGRTEETLAATVQRIRDDLGGDAVVDYVVGDATDPAEVRRAVTAATALTGQLKICVATVGGGTIAPLLLLDEEGFAAELRRNVVSAFTAIKHCVPAMANAGGGSIVCISSDSATMSWPFMASYCAGKAGLDALVRVAADELGSLQYPGERRAPRSHPDQQQQRLAPVHRSRAHRGLRRAEASRPHRHTRGHRRRRALLGRSGVRMGDRTEPGHRRGERAAPGPIAREGGAMAPRRRCGRPGTLRKLAD